MKARIRIRAAERLASYVNTDATEVIDRVETVMHKHNIKRQARQFPNPREYRKNAPETLMTQVQKELETLGFKFKRLPVHSMDTRAVESEGSYQSVDYILDLVFRYDQLEVDLYY